MTYWFVKDCYTVAGRPKAEVAVMNYARDKYMNCLLADYMLEDIQMELEQYCMKLREENKRLAPVRIEYSKSPRPQDDINRWLYIGFQHLSIQKVKEVIE